MLFAKEYLEGIYNWSPENERSVFDGDASRRLFNRTNGNQVLFIINLIMDCSRNFSVEKGRQIEKLIINSLPLTMRSEVSVYNWLQLEMAKGFVNNRFLT